MSHNGVSAGSSSGAMQLNLKTLRRPMTLVNEKESCVCSPCHGGGRRRALIPYATGGGCGAGVDPPGAPRARPDLRPDRPRSKTAQDATPSPSSLACRVRELKTTFNV